MSFVASRAFRTPRKAALTHVGATIADIRAQNPGKDVDKVMAAVYRIESEAEQRYGSVV